MASAPGVFKGQFECDFHCRRTVVGKEDLLQLRICGLRGLVFLAWARTPALQCGKGRVRDLDEPPREMGRRFAGEAQSGTMSDFFQLCSNGGVDFWMAM